MSAIEQGAASRGFLSVAWKHKLWWLPALVVLLGLIGIVYVLGHLSSTDSEMYPTSSRCLTSDLYSS
ncbi:MAG TPA: hypothetical protein VII25_11075 [Candidatus Acidoferrum sp.]